MEDLKSFLRNWIETYFDNLKNNTQEQKDASMSALKILGIEPSVDAVVSYFFGIYTGAIYVVAEMTETDSADFAIEMLHHVYPKIPELKKLMSD